MAVGFALAALGVIGYIVQLRMGNLKTPWYMPCLATLGVVNGRARIEGAQARRRRSFDDRGAVRIERIGQRAEARFHIDEQTRRVVQLLRRDVLELKAANRLKEFIAQRAAKTVGRRGLPEPERVLRRLGLEQETLVAADRLSGGQRQRLALGTGIVTAPDVLLVDEPTSQLDPVSAMAVVELLLVEAANGTTVIAVTHDPRVAAEMDLRLTLTDGRLS